MECGFVQMSRQFFFLAECVCVGGGEWGGYTGVSHRWKHENGFRWFLHHSINLWKEHEAVWHAQPNLQGAAALSVPKNNSREFTVLKYSKYPIWNRRKNVTTFLCQSFNSAPKLAPVAKTSVGSKRFKPNFRDYLKYFSTGNNINKRLSCSGTGSNEALSHSQSAFCFSFKLSHKFDHSWRIQETIK